MRPFHPPFADRTAAGKALAHELAARDWHAPIVLALPRGGVPVAYEIAKQLGAPLDLVMVRKIGAPGHQEYAIGAVVDGAKPTVVLDRKIAAMTGASEDYIERSVEAALDQIEQRRGLYGVDQTPDLKDRTAIIVDDGVATGSTVKAAIQGIRRSQPRRIVLAVPVAAPESLAALASLCDEMISLIEPPNFAAVGEHYVDFSQTSDEEVIALLDEARARPPQA